VVACDVSFGEHSLGILKQVVHVIGASVLQRAFGSSIATDGTSVKAADVCKELHDASNIIDVISSALSFVGRQGLAWSSALTVGVSSTEKQGRHDAVVSAVVGLTHGLAVSPLLVGGPGVFDGGTFPNIFAVIATRWSRKLTRDSSGGCRVCTASHAAGSTIRLSTIVVTASFRYTPANEGERMQRYWNRLSRDDSATFRTISNGDATAMLVDAASVFSNVVRIGVIYSQEIASAKSEHGLLAEKHD
jgi:hypothetical protein